MMPRIPLLTAAWVLVGVFIGWYAAREYYQPKAIQEKPAAPVWHDNGSLTAIRDPSAKPDLPAPTSPAGGVLIRTVEVTVRPKPVVNDNAGTLTNEPANESQSNASQMPVKYDCPAVTVRLDLHQYDDGIRVSVQSDGEVLDAVDIPRSTIFVHDVKPNVVGFDVSGDRKTIRYGRAFGALDLGLQVSEEAGDLTHGGWVSFRF